MIKKSIFDILFYSDFLKYKDIIDINELDVDGDNALAVAIMREDFDTACFLLEGGINITSLAKYSEHLLSNMLNTDSTFEVFLSSFEYLSRTRDNPKLQKLLIEKGISLKPNEKATNNNLCLTYHAGDLEILKTLIKNKNSIFSPDPHYKGDHQETALNNIPFNHDCWDYLIKIKKTPVNNFPSQSINPLIFSLVEVKDFEKLIELGGDINLLNNRGNPLLFNARKNNIEYLLKNVKNPYVKNKEGQNILFKSPFDCIDKIMEQCPEMKINEIDENNLTPLMFALSRNENKKVQKLLENGADPNLLIEDNHCFYFIKSEESLNILFNYKISFDLAFLSKKEMINFENKMNEIKQNCEEKTPNLKKGIIADKILFLFNIEKEKRTILEKIDLKVENDNIKKRI